MIDWEEVIKAESTEELKEIKLWLFQENMRLEQERTELEQARNKFLDERVKLRDELDELNRRTVMERKRLKEENLFFEKKMAILQEGFRQLEEDRKRFEQERQTLSKEARERQNRDQQRIPETEAGRAVLVIAQRIKNKPEMKFIISGFQNPILPQEIKLSQLYQILSSWCRHAFF